ncbi:hypothetical protein, partial [Serratia marcescens]|uniref:hypothetical protein n=1 Tax=Serratia marcescens TaxID=615 RepID=UPI002813CF7D
CSDDSIPTATPESNESSSSSSRVQKDPPSPPTESLTAEASNAAYNAFACKLDELTLNVNEIKVTANETN